MESRDKRVPVGQSRKEEGRGEFGGREKKQIKQSKTKKYKKTPTKNTEVFYF